MRIWTGIGILLLIALVPLSASTYMLYIFNMIGLAAIAVIGLNILIGFTGQISLGHGAFFGVGAYAGAIFSTALHLPMLLCIPAAGLTTALVGMIFGIPSGRLKGLYLTIATLAGQFIIEYVLIHWESLTKGTMGITIFRYKRLSFGISSFYAGFAGALWAFYMGSITAEPFNLGLSVEYIAMVIIGGLGSISGSIFGAVFITLLNEALRFMAGTMMNSGLFSTSGLYIALLREFVFGLAIVLFILLETRGLAELWRIIRSNFRLWPFSY